jgi:hypothetical protein
MNTIVSQYHPMTKSSQSADTPRKEFRQRWGFAARLHQAICCRLESRLGIHVYNIYSRSLAKPQVFEDPPAAFSHQLFGRHDAALLLQCARRPELDLTPEFVLNALRKGDVCSAILHNGEIVSFCWLAAHATRVTDGIYVAFAGKDRYFYFHYTVPEFRGRHLPRLFASRRDADSLIRGFSDEICYIAIYNRASIRAALALGFEKVGLAGYFKLGPLFFSFRSPAVRARQFGFRKLQTQGGVPHWGTASVRSRSQ